MVGAETLWNKPKPLLKPYVSDYKINVFEIAWLDDETVAKFKSDFRLIADYHVQTRRNDRYVPSEKTIKHLIGFGALMDDYRFAKTAEKLFEEKKKVTMCEYIDRLEENGVEKAKWSIIEEMPKDKLAIPQISRYSKFSVEEITDFARSHGYTPVMG